MNRKYIFVAVGVLVAGLVGIGLHRWWQNRQLSPAWAAVPVNAVMVFEADNPMDTWTQWQENPTWQSIAALPYFQTLRTRLDSLQQHAESRQVLAKKKILFSLHVTTRTDFDYVFYIPLSESDHAAVTKLIQHFRKHPDYRVDTRTFGGELITEITHRPSRQLFSFVLQDDMLMGSYTSFLVEDMVRKLNESAVNRNTQWMEWQAAHQAQQKDLRAYVNLAALPRLVQVATGNASDAGILGTAGQFGGFTLTQEENTISLKGKTYLSPEAQGNQYFSVFEGQSPQAISCLSLIPNQTAVLYHWSFSKPDAFFKQQQQYDLAHSGQSPEAHAFTWMGKEMALALVETTGDQPDRIFYVQASKPAQAVQEIQALANEPDGYTETYAGATIRQIREAEFPARLFGPAVQGFPQCFYALIGSHVVFGNSVQSLKTVLDKRTTGDVWGQSEKKRRDFQSPALFRVHVDVDHAWALLLKQLVPHWRQLLLQHSDAWKNFETVNVRVTAGESRALNTELVATYREKAAGAPQTNTLLVNWRANADTLLVSAPVLVRSHVDRSREVLIQDAAHRLSLINQSGKILWHKWLESSIQSEIHQVDYLKNNKLQYLFATRSTIHILDRNGNPVAPYPLKVPTATGLHTLSLIDYDGNREYRFLVSDLLGNLYMYDKAGNLLEGWNPLPTGYRLQCAPHHLRLHGKDYFVVVQANGKLTLLNRRGQAYPGFPVDLAGRTESDFLIENGLTPETTYVTIVTKDGEIIRVNLLGKTTERRQLYRTSGTNAFRLCAEPAGRDWVVARMDNRNVGILDQNGQLLWETARQSAELPQVQYYNFGAGLRLVALTDPTLKQTSIYDLNGHLIGGAPVPSSHPIAGVYVDAYDKLLIYYTNKAQAGLLSVKMK